MLFFMKTFFLTLVTLILSLLNGNTFLLNTIHLSLMTLLPFLLTLFLFLHLLLMTLLLYLFPPTMSFILPFHLFPLDSQLEFLLLLLICKIIFVIPLFTLSQIIYLIISCLINILVLFLPYIPTLNPNPSLRQIKLIVGSKQCKLNFLLLNQLVHGS